MRKAGNKKYLSTFLFMLAMVFVFSARTPQTVQAMSKSTQHKLYKKTMQDYARKSKASYKRNSLYIGGSGSSKKVMYLFVDIDKNGTDEKFSFDSGLFCKLIHNFLKSGFPRFSWR